jgi:hypothetical protein
VVKQKASQGTLALHGSGVREKISLSVSTRCNGPLGSLAKRARLIEVERMRTLLRAAVASTERVAELRSVRKEKERLCKVHPMCLPVCQGHPAKRDRSPSGCFGHFPHWVPESLVHQNPVGVIHLPRPAWYRIPETLPSGFDCSLLIATRGHMKTPSQPG